MICHSCKHKTIKYASNKMIIDFFGKNNYYFVHENVSKNELIIIPHKTQHNPIKININSLNKSTKLSKIKEKIDLNLQVYCIFLYFFSSNILYNDSYLYIQIFVCC